ncbi:hypothetical protein RR46_04167 [Papilio xuthus]|uniref:Protein takeout n=1 Tax=Papilio xuthus TaxID=66420 RepID=A0A194QNI7_PAPXU|nr:hypothetical protein RR46_04167 [Papilio xuthus]
MKGFSIHNDAFENIFNYLKKPQTSGEEQDSFPMLSLESVRIPPVNYYYNGMGLRNKLVTVSVPVTVLVDKRLNTSFVIIGSVVYATGDYYNLQGKAFYFYTIEGTGIMRLVLREPVVWINVQFGTNNKNGTKILNFSINYNVQEFDVYLENISWPVNEILDKAGDQILAEHKQVIVEAVRNHLVPLINEHIKNIPPSELLQMIRQKLITN